MSTLQEALEEKKKTDLKQLINDPRFGQVPKVGEIVKGNVLSVSRSLVRVDLGGWRVGVVRGAELYRSPEYLNLKIGDEAAATVVDLENENGELELSFREAGHRRAWDGVLAVKKEGAVVSAKVKDANKGGLILVWENLSGFMPVSQLSPEHYPRVAGGDKNKILEKLRSFVGQDFKVKVIDIDERENKVIFSEKAVWEAEKKSLLDAYKVGETVDGRVSALADFGAFVRFGDVEGLIHISEIAWQRLDHPADVLKVGEEVKAQIIQIEGFKIFLSRKRLLEDPWKKVGEKYQMGQRVKGKVLKVNPFGLFVELDPEIHGLAHSSGLSSDPVKDASEAAKEGDVLDFEIVSLEPVEHRLGLKLAGAVEENKSAPPLATA